MDPDNANDLFVLHCIFLPIIKHQLESFSEAWNLHSVRTERHWTPRKMWINGMIAADNRGQVAVRDVVEGMQDDAEEFGVQYDPPLAEEQVHTIFLPRSTSAIFGFHKTVYPTEAFQRVWNNILILVTS